MSSRQAGTGGDGARRDGTGWTDPVLVVMQPLTTFHRSFTTENTLRMSACSAPPLILSAGTGRCPHFLPGPSGPLPAAASEPAVHFSGGATAEVEKLRASERQRQNLGFILNSESAARFLADSS